MQDCAEAGPSQQLHFHQAVAAGCQGGTQTNKPLTPTEHVLVLSFARRTALKLVPHSSFELFKLWLLAAKVVYKVSSR
jgi:hypothetical protein